MNTIAVKGSYVSDSIFIEVTTEMMKLDLPVAAKDALLLAQALIRAAAAHPDRTEEEDL